MDIKHCKGCSDNFYNHGNNSTSGKCWSLPDAKLVDRIAIGHWENPPYLNKKIVRVPNCWHGEGYNRTHYIKKEALDSQGYWKT